MLKFDANLYTLITRCIRCGECSYGDENIEYEELCPIYRKFMFFSHSPAGIVQIARAYIENRIRDLTSINEIVFKCTGCGICNVCGIIDSPMKISIILKNELRKGGYLPPTGVENINKNIDETGISVRKKLYSSKIENLESDILYFVGCKERIAEKTVKILNNLKINFSVSNNLKCCGLPLYLSGNLELFEKIVKQNINELMKIKPKTLIFSCGSCYFSFKNLYPELPFEIVYISDFLKDFNVNGRDDIQKVTYHDPCKLGRGCEEYKSPRELLKKCGFELIEMRRSKGNSLCCGAGNGIVKASFPKFSIDIAKERIVEAENTQAEAIVTSCSSCVENLKRGAKLLNSKIKVFHLLDMVNL